VFALVALSAWKSCASSPVTFEEPLGHVERVPIASNGAFKYRSYAEMVKEMRELENKYPEFVKLHDAQTEFEIAHAGECDEFAEDGGSQMVSKPCKQWFLVITNYATWTDEEEQSLESAVQNRPVVLLSGELHGDERVGPHASIEVAKLLAAEKDRLPWLKQLLDTRVLVIVPMTNAIGFAKSAREEIQQPDGVRIDPNRDFPFDQSPKLCMQTIAARTINELLRKFTVSLMLTFHGGTNVIGYEWGDYGHCSQTGKCDNAPDHAFMDALGKRMKEYAGPAGQWEREYVLGSMGETVYPVHGGMEDWAYGASWSGDEIRCQPETMVSFANPYPPKRTSRSTYSQRCITYLIETSTSKRPEENTLGSWSDQLLTIAGGGERGSGNGHVARNVRLAIAAIDAVRPYVLVIPSVPPKIEPVQRFGGISRTSAVMKAASMAKNASAVLITVPFAVGGVFSVDAVFVQWSTKKSASVVQSGATLRQSGAVSMENSMSGGASPESLTTYGMNLMSTVFFLPTNTHGEDVFFRVALEADSELSGGADGAQNNKPESHAVRARKNRLYSDTWRVQPSQVLSSDDSGSALSRLSREELKALGGWGVRGQLYAKEPGDGAGDGSSWAGVEVPGAEPAGNSNPGDSAQTTGSKSVWAILGGVFGVMTVGIFAVLGIIVGFRRCFLRRRLAHQSGSGAGSSGADPAAEAEMEFLAEWEADSSSNESTGAVHV